MLEVLNLVIASLSYKHKNAEVEFNVTAQTTNEKTLDVSIDFSRIR